MYLTYEVYQSMGGTLSEATFSDLNYEAQSYVDYMTFNRLENDDEIPEKVLQCIYHIIGILYNKALLLNMVTDDNGDVVATAATVSSQSNDGVSVSFNTLSASDLMKSSEAEVQGCIKRYLQGVTNNLGRRLLYRGFYPGE